MLGALGTVMITGATMVGLDAAEFIAFSTIGKKLKQSKGANQMITVNDFIAQAKAKKAHAAQATVNVVEKVKEAAHSAKEAVVGAMPTSHAYVDKVLDQRTLEIMIVVEALRQEVRGEEMDIFGAVTAAQNFLGMIKAPKMKAEPMKVESAQPAEPKDKAMTKGKRKFDTPDNWDEAPLHG